MATDELADGTRDVAKGRTRRGRAPRGKAHIGRPRELSDDVANLLADRIRFGAPIKYACGAAGISRHTFYDWMRRGREERENRLVPTYVADEAEDDFVNFVDTIEAARDEGTVMLLLEVRAHARNHWQAGAWLLERTRREDFARHVEVSGAGGDPVKIQPDVSIADLERKVQAILKQRGLRGS